MIKMKIKKCVKERLKLEDYKQLILKMKKPA